MSLNCFDCIVVGAGHAGAEAAHASAKLGAKTLMITMSRDAIARMSCNPAIGGVAKGQIVREIDALGGLMARAIDASGIQFRLLNRSKGPAVQSPRAQADKDRYKNYVRARLEDTAGLTIFEDEVVEILTVDQNVRGVRCKSGNEYLARAVIVTTGTFLRGIMHLGDKQWPGGRLDEPASDHLSDSLRSLGFDMGRLKTGTPARLDGKTLDYDKLERQPGDDVPLPFSFMNDSIDIVQVPCWITWTNEAIHQLLRDNFHRAPMYTGQIDSEGPRYCPSIETKIVRFADKTRHQVFLEPEDTAGTTIYCNGISTSVPKDVQDRMIRLLPGTENARIVHYAYAIEYDYCPAVQLRCSLETRKIGGLFFAGQINGTSGYEEAAGQGLIAGINAVRKLTGDEPLVLGRDQAYIGVLIDDLLTKDINEPYRMFTSRAEYRLTLRSDNADRRLTPLGKDIGLVDRDRWDKFSKKLKAIDDLSNYLKKKRQAGKSFWQMIKHDDDPVRQFIAEDQTVNDMDINENVIDAVVIDSIYEGYLERQAKHIAGFKNLENVKLSERIDYNAVAHLSNEGRSKLSKFRPDNLAQASRVGGVTPADITVLRIYLKAKQQQ